MKKATPNCIQSNDNHKYCLWYGTLWQHVFVVIVDYKIYFNITITKTNCQTLAVHSLQAIHIGCEIHGKMPSDMWPHPLQKIKKIKTHPTEQWECVLWLTTRSGNIFLRSWLNTRLNCISRVQQWLKTFEERKGKSWQIERSLVAK